MVANGDVNGIERRLSYLSVSEYIDSCIWLIYFTAAMDKGREVRCCLSVSTVSDSIVFHSSNATCM